MDGLVDGSVNFDIPFFSLILRMREATIWASVKRVFALFSSPNEGNGNQNNDNQLR